MTDEQSLELSSQLLEIFIFFFLFLCATRSCLILPFAWIFHYVLARRKLTITNTAATFVIFISFAYYWKIIAEEGFRHITWWVLMVTVRFHFFCSAWAHPLRMNQFYGRKFMITERGLIQHILHIAQSAGTFREKHEFLSMAFVYCDRCDLVIKVNA